MPASEVVVPHITLRTIFVTFVRIGLVSVGGGGSAHIHRAVVERLRWIDEARFVEAATVTRTLPGTNVSNLAAFIGGSLRGAPGAAAAAVGVLLPGVVAVVCAAVAYTRMSALHSAAGQGLLRGLTAGALGVMVVLVSFGGGLAIVPEMHRQLVDAHWLSEGEFADGYAIGQLAPGPNMLAIVFYGYRLAGPLGALFATGATFGPGIVASAAIGCFMTKHAEHRLVSRLRRGLVPVGVGLMIAGVFVLGRSVVVGPLSAVLAVGVAVLVGAKWVSPAVAVVAAGVIGALATL